MTLGLGLLVGKAARFYPKSTVSKPIEDTLGSEKVKIDVQPSGHMTAVLVSGARPQQYFIRWYGFSLNFPGCSIYGQQAD